MKKGVIIISIILVMLLVGCVNYKTQPQDQEDTELINEIAKLEQDLQQEKKNKVDPVEEVMEPQVGEEIILPELTEEPAAASQTQLIQVNENELVKLSVKVSDPDQDPIEYSFTPPLNKAGLWKTNYGDAGEYDVIMTATDGKLTTEKKIKIIVNRINVAPQLSGVADLQVREGEVVRFKPVAIDPNKDQVTITVSDPLKKETFETDHTSAGEYQIEVIASDGELETKRSFTLLIEDVNELPVLTNLEDLRVKEGEMVKIQPTISDLDGDQVTITISEPVGDKGVWVTKFTDHGEYLVTVVADDGKGTVTKKLKVIVEDVNMPPEIVEVKLAVN